MTSRLFLFGLVLGACTTAPPTGPIGAGPDTTSRPPTPGTPVVEDGPFADLEDYRQQRAAVLADLEDAIGTPTANGTRSCLVLPVGRKACGGPSSFRAYSTETAEVPVLLGLAKRVADLDLEAVAQFELASDCMLLTPPPVVLEDGMCVLAQ